MTDTASGKLNVLFLPKWYPDRNDTMTGIFIQHLAELLKPGCSVTVLYVTADQSASNCFEIVEGEESGIRVIRIYFRPIGINVPVLTSLGKMILFFIAGLKGMKRIGENRPDIIHAHVLTRNGVLAWFCSKRFHAPYIISEHWSRYFPFSSSFPGYCNRKLMQALVNRSAALLPVSLTLKDALSDCGIQHRNTRIIGNSVDTDWFSMKPDLTPSSHIRILHVSCFQDHAKNISGLLRVIKQMAGERDDFTLTLVGEGPDLHKLKAYSREIGIPENFVKFADLLTGKQLVKAYHESDFLVQSSNYETFGTVIIEALSCGIPVVATSVGVAREIITPETGLLIEPGDENEMLTAMKSMLDRYRDFSPETIRAVVISGYSRQITARKMFDVYQNVTGS